MVWPQLLFWFSLAILFYCFIGYTIFLWVLVKLKKLFFPGNKREITTMPPLTFIVAAYNEKDFIQKKIENTLALDYPKDKLFITFVTDGSDDGTDKIVSQYTSIKLLHQPERKGKSAAINRAMENVSTPITVFSDANTLLNREALQAIIKKYNDENTGGVSGEKKVETVADKTLHGSGEGIYWKYESFLKQQEAEFGTLVGSAGEFFSVRTKLFKPIPPHIVLDDFYMALSINQQGCRVGYAPSAIATETPSASLKEEKKRKVRIAAGAYQISYVFTGLLNIFKHPVFAFQFFSHKILRWYTAPLCIILLFAGNYLLRNENEFYQWVWYAQIIFYVAALMGWRLQKTKPAFTLFYFPFYFLFMNYCTLLGWFRYLSGRQNVLWEKSQREIIHSNP